MFVVSARDRLSSRILHRVDPQNSLSSNIRPNSKRYVQLPRCRPSRTPPSLPFHLSSPSGRHSIQCHELDLLTRAQHRPDHPSSLLLLLPLDSQVVPHLSTGSAHVSLARALPNHGHVLARSVRPDHIRYTPLASTSTCLHPYIQ